jgi:hypothetical protein
MTAIRWTGILNTRIQFLTLHYNIFNGVSIFPQQVNSKKSDNKAVMEVAHFLQRQVF